MSGKKAKDARRARRSRPARQANAEKVLLAATAVLNIELADLPPERSVQVPLGWLRAEMNQCRAIVVLSQGGPHSTASPNRRLATEILLRLQWLMLMPSESRSGAIDAMIDEEKRMAGKHKSHVLEMGLTESPNLGDIDAVLTQATDDPKLQQEAKSIANVAKATFAAGLYRAWRDETQMAHSTIQLAAAYAPKVEGQFERGTAPAIDQELELVLSLATFALIFTSKLLLEAGVGEEAAFRFFRAFFAAIRKAA